MIRQSRSSRHSSERFRGSWKWLLTYRSAATCVGDGAASVDFLGCLGLLNLVKQLRLSLLFVILTVVISSFPIALVAESSSTSNISPALEMKFNTSSLALGRLSRTSNRRAGRFSTQEDMKPANRRRLSPQYMCTWKKQICEQEPISFLLGTDCCNSGCTNLKTDMFNCGTCGRICFYGSMCCSGVCTDIFSNNEHCGSCSNNCPLGEVCQYGICGYT